ncbi:MAG: tRNA methyltransferase, partial [Candidatus Altarchaeaceae archaeon]
MENLKEFREYHSSLFDVDKFLEWIKKPMRKSIRVNTLKITPEKLFERLKFKKEKVPWSENAYFIYEKGRLGNTIEHTLGYYYIQEAASMIPVEVLDV